MFHIILVIHLFSSAPSHITLPLAQPNHQSVVSPAMVSANGATQYSEAVATETVSNTFSDKTISEANINFPGLGTGLKKLIGSATGVLTEISIGFFGLLLGLAILAYAWNHNNPKRLQESRTAIMRVLEACAMFGLIGVLLGIVHSVVSFAS